MEGGRNNGELDEFEILLGEIPNVTSGKPHFRNGIVTLDDALPAGETRHHEMSLSEKLQKNEDLHKRSSVGKLQQLSFEAQGRNPPNDQSLTSAFRKMSLANGLSTEAANSPLANYKSSSTNGTSFPMGYPNTFNNSSFEISPRFGVYPPQSPGYKSAVCFDYDVKRTSQAIFDSVKQDGEQFQGHQNEISWFARHAPAAFPLANGAQGLRLLPKAPDVGMSDQQHYLLQSHYMSPCMNSPQLSQSRVTWMHVDDEQRYYMNQQSMYHQQLHNQRIKVPPTRQANCNVAKLMTQKPNRLHPEMPHRLRKYDQEPVFVNHPFFRGSNLYGPAIPSGNFNSVQVSDNVEKRKLPRKILTRPDGPNSFRESKFDLIDTEGSVSHFNQNRRVSNGRSGIQGAGRTPSDGFRWQDLPIGNIGSSINCPGSQPIKVNSLEEAKGKVCLMAKDQHGCRFLQRKFSEGTREDIEMIFVEIIDNIVELMTDPFGNYLFQKLLEVCNESQRMQILNAITRKPGDLVRISCDMHGTRAVQKVIETLKSQQQFSKVVTSLEPGIVTLMKNANGNHVAQRCLQYLMPEHKGFLFEAATRNCIQLGTDRHGCCVLQKCLNYSDGERRRKLIYEITSNALILSQDQYGNYVVQFVFDLGVIWAAEGILDQLEGNYGDLSVQKYSSNVVEKCLQFAREDRRRRIIRELINNYRLDQIMQDPYGNFVIQSALNHSKGALHSALVEAIMPHIPALRTSPFGKKVLSCDPLRR